MPPPQPRRPSYKAASQVCIQLCIRTCPRVPLFLWWLGIRVPKQRLATTLAAANPTAVGCLNLCCATVESVDSTSRKECLGSGGHACVWPAGHCSNARGSNGCGGERRSAGAAAAQCRVLRALPSRPRQHIQRHPPHRCAAPCSRAGVAHSSQSCCVRHSRRSFNQPPNKPIPARCATSIIAKRTDTAVVVWL